MIKVVDIKKVKLTSEDFVKALNEYLTKHHKVRLTDQEFNEVANHIDDSIDLEYGLEVVDTQVEIVDIVYDRLAILYAAAVRNHRNVAVSFINTGMLSKRHLIILFKQFNDNHKDTPLTEGNSKPNYLLFTDKGEILLCANIYKNVEEIDIKTLENTAISDSEACSIEIFTTSKIESFIENIQNLCDAAATDSITYAIKYSMSNEFSRQDVFNLLNRILSERDKPLLSLDAVDRGNFIKIDKHDVITVVPVANWRYDHFYIIDYLSKPLSK